MAATGLISAEADRLLNEMAATHTWVQLHTDVPGAAGTANVATESGREQVTWSAATGGTLVSAADVVWANVAGSETYTHYSVWSASSGGTCGFTGTITANAVSAGDRFIIPSGELTAFFAVAS